MSVKIIKPPSKSTFITTKKRVKHAYCCPEIFVGDKCNKNFRSLIQFNFDTLPGIANITSGILNLFIADNTDSVKEKTIAVFQVISRWNEKKVKWKTQPLIADCPTDTIRICNQTHCFVSFNITSLIDDWYTNRAANFGLMLMLLNKDQNSRVSFISGKGINSLYWPYLEINLHDPVCNNCSKPLDLTIYVVSSIALQTTAPYETMMYNYSYNVVNLGNHPAKIYLQTSADGVHWITESEIYTILPQTSESLVPGTISRYSHLCYQSFLANQDTNLAVHIQGNSI